MPSVTDCLREGGGISQFLKTVSLVEEEEDEEEESDDEREHVEDDEDDEELEEVRDTVGERWRGRYCDFIFTTEVDWTK